MAESPKIPPEEIMRRQAIIDAYWGAQRDAEDYKRRQAQHGRAIAVQAIATGI